MEGVEEMLLAAGKLSNSELARFRSEFEKLERRRNALTFDHEGIFFQVNRIPDETNYLYLHQSIAIKEESLFWLYPHFPFREDPERLTQPEQFLALRNLFGESSRQLDDYKQAFSFPFRIEVRKGDTESLYLLDLHCTGSINYCFRKIVDKDDPRLKTRSYHDPYEEEFGREDMRYFIAFFEGYLQGNWRVCQRESLAPCLLRIERYNNIFGFVGGLIFDEEYESREEFDTAWENYQAQLRTEQASGILRTPNPRIPRNPNPTQPNDDSCGH